MNRTELKPWLDLLEGLPFVRRIELRKSTSESADATLLVHTPDGKQEYQVEVKTAKPLGYATLEPLLARARQRGGGKWLLLAPYIATPMASRLQAAHIDYVDQAGNCYIDAAGQFFANVEGRKLARDVKRSRPRGAGYQLLFALAAKPGSLALPVRELARLAGIGKSATAAMLSQLTDEGLIADAASGRRILRPGQLFERWTSAYPDIRRRWLQGRYRAQASNTEDLEQGIAAALPANGWAWGGTAAAMRLIPHYRGAETILHIIKPDPDLPKRIRAIPDRQGPITILITPPPLAFESPVPQVVHPLLVYSELLASGDERARDTATKIRERFLGSLS